MWDPKRFAAPQWFLDRERERLRLAELIRDRDNVLVYGLRRLGKSSLIRKVASELGDHHFLIVNCQFVDSEAKLSTLLLDAIRETKLARARQFLDWARHAAKDLEVGVEVRGDSVTPVLRVGAPRPRPLEDTLEFVTRVARAAKARFVIVLDEFQSLMATNTTTAKLREHAQSQNHASYVLSGSQPSVLLNLTRHKNPFWRQLTELPVGPIDVGAACKDVARLAKSPVPEESRQLLESVTRGNTQRLAEVLEASWNRFGQFGPDAVNQAMRVVVGRHAAGFERIVAQLTPYQRQVVEALAKGEPEHPTGATFVNQFRLRGPAYVHKAMEALRRLEILDDAGGFVDPLFAWWVKHGGSG